MSTKANRGGKMRRCEACGQDVAPVERTSWKNFWAWIALLQFAAMVAAIVNTVSAIGQDTAGGVVGRLILWPATVHPAWTGILAAVGAFLVAAVLSGKAGQRASAHATCPRCGSPLHAPAAAG